MAGKFIELYEKYLKNSSCNEDQARFIWNNAIEEAAKCAEEQQPGCYQHVKELNHDQELEQYF